MKKIFPEMVVWPKREVVEFKVKHTEVCPLRLIKRFKFQGIPFSWRIRFSNRTYINLEDFFRSISFTIPAEPVLPEIEEEVEDENEEESETENG